MTTLIRRCSVAALALIGSLARAACAQDAPTGAGRVSPWILGTQLNFIGQRLQPLHSPYAGVNSLRWWGDTEMSQAYGIYLGGALVGGLQAYLDVEMIRGNGVSSASGLAGITDGDVLRQGTVQLGKRPYVARLFLRYAIGLGGAARDTLPAAPDQGAMVVASRRLEIAAGKLAVTDLLDVNRYANSTRLQFQNWGLFQNTAWDYAADTRGYSYGVAVALIGPGWALRAASFQMPTYANGNVLDGDVAHARGDQIELTLGPIRAGTVIRLLGYVNHARMGSYADAIAVARRTGQVPDIVADDRPGRTKFGWGVNVEQPLADSGETGVFGRLGWSDGKNESFVFTEVDRHLSAGIQVSGVRWGRRREVAGVGFVDHGLSPLHREYLARGGHGFLLGDGALNYGHERILEAYYRIQIGPWVEVSPDVQQIWNPGYNRDRGPATVLGLRINARY